MLLKDLNTVAVLRVLPCGGVHTTIYTTKTAVQKPIILEESKGVLLMEWTFILMWPLSP